MDYKAIKFEIDNHYKEIFNAYLLALKGYMKEKGTQTSPFIETLWLDVSEWEIVYESSVNSGFIYDTTIDKIYYIPSKDELGFVIYKGHTTNIYKQGPFTQRHINMLGYLFNFYCSGEYGN